MNNEPMVAPATPGMMPVDNGPQVEIEGEENTKKAKISKAQEYMFFAVAGASLVAGITLVVAIFLMRYIGFNMEVIGAKDEAIEAYSVAIKNVGACPAPKGDSYTLEELKNCNPNDVSIDSVPNTLRYNVLMGMTGNVDLDSVARDSVMICYNADKEPYTYDELQEKYQNADTSSKREYYLGLIKMCSSLRVIPDALPGVWNEAAMMSSVNKIFQVSNSEPEALTPNGSAGTGEEDQSLNEMSLSLSITGGSETTMRVLSNLEKSVRNFDINTATIEWNGDNLMVGAQATAYYTDGANIVENTVTIDPEKEDAKK